MAISGSRPNKTALLSEIDAMLEKSARLMDVERQIREIDGTSRDYHINFSAMMNRHRLCSAKVRNLFG